ncbi:cell wall protein, partial [Geosmithia morbida]
MISFITAALALAGSAVALPTARAANATVDVFGILALRSASPIHYGSVSASIGNLFINRAQDAECASNISSAEFYIKDGGLFLYGDGFSNETQQVYVDRSGMGQGNVGYVTSNTPAPRSGELTGWSFNSTGGNRYLQFDGASLLACPSIDNSYALWVDVGVAAPGGSTECLGFKALAADIAKPVPCKYS